MKNKNGMTPIVAIILLLMMTIAAASASFYWLIRIQSQMQGGAESYQENIFDRLASTVNWLDADYNATTEVLTIYLQNVGTTDIPLDNSTANPTTTWILKDSEQFTICESKFDGVTTNADCYIGCGPTSKLQAGSSSTLYINLTDTSCDVSGYTDDSLMRVSIFFSGDAMTSGTFET